MIVQNYPDKYIMISQHDHAAISGGMARMWKPNLFHGKNKRSSVEFAVRNHDVGWKRIDEAPFWNDKKSAPYTFTDFPAEPKTVLYRYGIEEVLQEDSYAALLCSRHYTRFMQNNTSDAAQKFVQEEKTRRERIITSLDGFDREAYEFHYGVLQMLDDLSLFICLNEPSVRPENSHPFFKKGIKRNEAVTNIPEDKLQIYWKDARTVCLAPFIFSDSFTVFLKHRCVEKQAIEQDGLLTSYQQKPVETIDITIAPM